MVRFLLALTLLASIATVAQADTITNTYDLGTSGWRLTGPAFNELNVVVDGQGVDPDGVPYVAIQISKKFRLGPDPATGIFPPINLDFQQILPDAQTATRIYIADETVTNLTGAIWTDFHWILFRHDVATFNQAKTNPTTDPLAVGWQINPFTVATWSVDVPGNTEQLAVSGGAIPGSGPGNVFFPGLQSGDMVIDLNLAAADPASFTFKEIPTPEPASLSLLGLGALALLRRRR